MKTESESPITGMSLSNQQPQVNWATELSDDVWRKVLEFVAPLELLKCVVQVNKRLHNMISTQQYWVYHLETLRNSPRCDEWLPTQQQVTTNYHEVYQAEWIRDTLNVHQLQRLCLFWVAHSKNHVFPDGLKHGSRLVSRIRAETIRNRHYRLDTSTATITRIQRRRVCLDTSTEHPTELLENVLEGRGAQTAADEIFHNLGILAGAFPQHQPFQWWSSRPSTTQEAQETLLFVTNCPLAVLSTLKIRPLLDPFTRGQIYSWNRAVVKAYRLPLSKLDPHPDSPHAGFPCSVVVVDTKKQMTHNSHEISDDEEEEVDPVAGHSTRKEAVALQQLLQNEIPIYISPDLPYNSPSGPCTSQRDVPWQLLVFPPTTVANVITITLHGKDSKQFPHSGYYSCVERVYLQGIPLLENVSLKYTQGMW